MRRGCGRDDGDGCGVRRVLIGVKARVMLGSGGGAVVLKVVGGGRLGLVGGATHRIVLVGDMGAGGVGDSDGEGAARGSSGERARWGDGAHDEGGGDGEGGRARRGHRGRAAERPMGAVAGGCGRERCLWGDEAGCATCTRGWSASR